MKTAFLISLEDKNLAKTIVSLEENSIRPDKYILLLNENTSEENKNIAKSLSETCCGKEAQSYVDKEYVISSKDNFTVIKVKDKSMGLNYITLNLLDDIDIIFTATSGTVFNSQYIEQVLSNFIDENIGLVYSDYSHNGSTVYLQYVQAMLANSINIKEVAVRKSIIKDNPFIENIFDFVMGIFSSTIIRHIPEELYVQ